MDIMEVVQKSMRTTMETEEKRVLQFWTVINMTMGNTLYKKRETQLLIYMTGSAKV